MSKLDSHKLTRGKNFTMTISDTELKEYREIFSLSDEAKFKKFKRSIFLNSALLLIFNGVLVFLTENLFIKVLIAICCIMEFCMYKYHISHIYKKNFFSQEGSSDERARIKMVEDELKSLYNKEHSSMNFEDFKTQFRKNAIKEMEIRLSKA